MEKGDKGKITICGCWAKKVLNSLVDAVKKKRENL
jgi:hypothetical protein